MGSDDDGSNANATVYASSDGARLNWLLFELTCLYSQVQASDWSVSGCVTDCCDHWDLHLTGRPLVGYSSLSKAKRDCRPCCPY